jgi:hypothetical protein
VFGAGWAEDVDAVVDVPEHAVKAANAASAVIPPSIERACFLM